MIGSFKNKPLISGVLLVTLAWNDLSLATDKADIGKSNHDAVTSLENVLQKAGEQGFVAIDQPETNKHKNKIDENDGLKPDVSLIETFGEINCSVTDTLDLSIYKSVSSFDDVSLVKAGIDTTNNLNDVLPLVKTYIALGLGAEAANLVKGYKSPEAKLLAAMGALIEGYPTVKQQATISQYANCNKASEFWALYTKTANLSYSSAENSFDLSRSNHELLESLPPELKKHVLLNLGIYAAEQMSDVLAERILTVLAPKTKYGKLPAVKDDALLYYFALVRQMKGDPKSHQILKYLAQYDGLYRTRSLQKLAEENFRHGTKLYDDFSNDLEAVTQQYNGQAESRQATLQVVKHRLMKDQFIDAIELSKREFALIDPERGEAVSLLGERINMRLESEDKTARLYALSGYVHDPLFFSKYENIEMLKNHAQESAMALNFPELVPVILPDAQSLSSEQKKQLHYSQARMALKQGRHDEAIKVAEVHPDDMKFQALILEAAISSGNRKRAIEVLRTKPADALRFQQQADLAWQKGYWGEAKIALEALAHKQNGNSVRDKIAITNYIGLESKAYIDRSIPDTSAELDLLKDQLNNDINLVKGYLDDG